MILQIVNLYSLNVQYAELDKKNTILVYADGFNVSMRVKQENS